MALPTKPTLTPEAQDDAAKAAIAAGEKKVERAAGDKIQPKRFGAAFTGEGESRVAVPTPTAAGMNLVDVSKKLYSVVTEAAAAAGVSIDELSAAVSNVDKANYPGHKDGRVAYTTANIMNALFKLNGLLSKQRNSVSLKAKLIEKDAQVKALEARIAELLAAAGKQA